MPPAWFAEQALLFRDAVDRAAAGAFTQCRRILSSIRSAEIQTWFIEHGQQSGRFRHLQFQKAASELRSERDERSPKEYENEVFERDGYVCRYCGLPVVGREVLKSFSKLVGPISFSVARENLARHGIALAFQAYADHIEPWALGGRTLPENLVTSCPGCNFGKANYSLEQLGLEDPRLRAPKRIVGWDGLMSLHAQVKKAVRQRRTGGVLSAGLQQGDSLRQTELRGLGIDLLTPAQRVELIKAIWLSLPEDVRDSTNHADLLPSASALIRDEPREA